MPSHKFMPKFRFEFKNFVIIVNFIRDWTTQTSYNIYIQGFLFRTF